MLLIELRPCGGVTYFDYAEGRFPKYYPGVREQDNDLRVTFIEASGEIVYIHSLHNRNTDRSQWKQLDTSLINPLDLQNLYEMVYLPYKLNQRGYRSKEVLDYLYQENRISLNYYNQELGLIK